MSLEQILEQTAHARPGYDLVSFKEAGLPVYVLKLRILVLERKELSPIEEAVLKVVRAGLDSPGSIYEFLGLSFRRSLQRPPVRRRPRLRRLRKPARH